MGAIGRTELRETRGWKRHLDGWQAGLVTVGIVLLSAVMAVPRPAVPGPLPLPAVDRAEQRRDAALLHQLAERAEREPLPRTVRAVGEALRELGAAEAAGRTPDVRFAHVDIRRLVPVARDAHGDEKLLELRALQTRLFVESVLHWATTGAANDDLRELGGGFLRTLRDSGWMAGDRLLLDPEELATLFQVRWTQLAGLLEEHPFAPTLNQWRAYYHAHITAVMRRRGESDRSRAERLVQYVSALARRDPDYPAALATGMLEFTLGRYEEAVTAFQRHLDENPGGAYRLRARNYQAAAAERVPPEVF